ncbi:TonB-dependent receptor [SAR92 clade bacterium H455]|uniref:TonB-dependent receptor n=1 Tax=SAR92 clade bacterium H455 TaxID=2974818 RepID=A0ABY5TLC9_9GAMM|nr:TonB-dependent receptor [SAR92 clade bacterium H455]
MTNRNRLKRGSSIAIARNIIIALGIISISFSSTASDESEISKPALYEEVLVTARKREEKLIDVPISISVVTDESIKNFKIRDIVDLAYYIPGMSASSSDASNRSISIRGVSNIQGTSPLSGVYLDEIPLSFAPSISVDLQTTDIQRVEVLKGPQGTLFGQGSMNGTVRFVTKKPSFDGVNGEIGLSAYDTESGDMSSELTAVLNLPAINDTLGFRVVTTAKDVGGWIDQPNANKDDANSYEMSYLHLKGLWKVSDKFTVDTQIIRYDSDAAAQNTVNVDPVFKRVYHVVIRDGFVPSTDSDYEYDIQNLTLSYEFDFATLIGSSSKITSEQFSSSVSAVIESPVGPPSEALTLGTYIDVDGTAHELRLVGKTGALNWVAGVFYTDVETESGYTSFSQNFGDLLLEYPGFKSILGSDSISYFLDFSYDVNSQLTISAGTRYYEDDRTDTFINAGTVLDNPDASFHKLSSKISLTYFLTDNTNLYARVAEGFRSGGSNVLNEKTYKPESLINYEVGAKSSLFEGRLITEAAIYFSQYKDYQEVEVDPTTNGILLLNPGEAEIRGVEWSTKMKITEQLTMGFSGHFSDSEFTELNVGALTKEIGDELNYAPKYTYSLTTSYNFNWPSATPGYFHFSYNRQGEQSLINRPTLDKKSSPLGNLSVQIGAKLMDFNISFFGRNLTNELRSTRPIAGQNHIPMRPRTYGVQLNYEF